MNYTSILLILILAIFLIWKRVKDKSKASTILAIISFVLTLVYVAFIVQMLIDSDPEDYGYILIPAIICSPVLIGVGLVAFLRDRKNRWARISFILSICAILLSFLMGLAFDHSN